MLDLCLCPSHSGVVPMNIFILVASVVLRVNMSITQGRITHKYLISEYARSMYTYMSRT